MLAENFRWTVAAVLITATLLLGAYLNGTLAMAEESAGKRIALPEPRREGDLSLEAALWARRSSRGYAAEALTLAAAGQLLWAAQGVNRPGDYRTAPSAGALFPLESYLVAGGVTGLDPGVYRYRPPTHDLVQTAAGDRRAPLSRAALGQGAVRRAPAVLVLCAVFERTTGKYRRRGLQYVYMEAGHAAQNFLLQAASLGLGTVPIGAFRDAEVAAALELPPGEHPLYLLPVGKP
jgi:SagB-type dehydrogenase family enzyme